MQEFFVNLQQIDKYFVDARILCKFAANYWI